jgi:hypothetical protein
MSTVTETGIALEWFTTMLANDNALLELAPGGVHRSMAPPGTTPPWVIVAFQSGQDVLTMNAYRVMSNLLWQIKVVGPADLTSQLIAAAARIDDLIGLASGTATGGLVLSCFRDSPLQLDELVNGVLWSNIGGLYRPYIQKTS